jgi:hypothetical protein
MGRDFSLHNVQTGSEPTQHPIPWVLRFSSGVKRQNVKRNIHLNLQPRFRMRGAIPPLPQYVFMAWCLIKHRGELCLTFTLNICGSTDYLEVCFKQVVPSGQLLIIAGKTRQNERERKCEVKKARTRGRKKRIKAV